MITKKIFLTLVFSLACLSQLGFFSSAKAEEPQNPVRIFFFHTDSCPHCKDEEKFLEELEKKYSNIEIHGFEVSSDFKNQNLFEQVVTKFNLSGGVPVTIIDDQPIVGFDSAKGLGKKIEEKVVQCSDTPCNSYLNEVLGLSEIEGAEENKEEIKTEEGQITMFGKEYNLRSGPVYLWGIVLGLADGINPCMFSVLLFLITYLLAIGSRKKMMKAGIAFVITTFIVYFLFMYGIIQIIDVLKIASFARWIIIGFSFIVGLIMIKDFFFYQRWISLEISPKFKPYLEKLVKKGTVFSAILLAIVASLVELPCTSGIPLAYVSILTTRDVSIPIHLFVYNLFFILPLLIIILGVAFTWTKAEKVEAWREKSKKYMRLVAGILLLFLSFALLFNWL
jgi:cytochrome c biogenesis protein CcdA/glutaredoxin